ncbi:MAG: ThiF family adenylyltransferase [Planctomycetes bacterium]|nr:ThiF family adenylyltransferase [Planctomycetota bacterium]
MLLEDIGQVGQQKLAQSHALIVGCGALGTVIADSLARAGVGTLSIVDRDTVEITNLQRQVLFDENDVLKQIPKAQAAKAKLAKINSQIKVNAHVTDFSFKNAQLLIEDVDILLDGLDNFQTRYLLNDLAVANGLPYIYGGAVGTTGMSLAILPHSHARKNKSPQSSVSWPDELSTPCLRCIFPEAPPPGASPTCDTAGVLGAVVSIIASHQVAQAIKLLTGNMDRLDRSLLSIDVWLNQHRTLDVSTARNTSDCPCCVKGEFEFLFGQTGGEATSLCGRNAVQINPQKSESEQPNMDLSSIALNLNKHGTFTVNQYLLHGQFTNEQGKNGIPVELTLFPDGRAIVKGTDEPEFARSIYAKYIGN